MDTIKLHCYICNSSIDRKKQNSSYQIYTPTKYSQTLIAEYINKFLEYKQDVRFNQTDSICTKCMDKLNEYDKACKIADRIEYELKQALHLTEQTYIKQEYVEFLDNYDDASDLEQKPSIDIEIDADNGTQEECEGIIDTADSNYETWAEDNVEQNAIESWSIEEKYDCAVCKDNPKNYGALCQHDKAAPGQRSKNKTGGKTTKFLECEYCSETFSTKTLFKNHQVKLHNPKKCGVCQKQFCNSQQLRIHQRSDHELQYSYECGNCGKNFKTEALLTRHISIHETAHHAVTEDDEKLYRCNVCGQIETTEDELTVHMEKHEGQLKCVICGTIVKHKANLILHMRIHTGAKFFQCDKCGKEFVHKSSLRMHFQTTHSEVRKKQCPECPLNFKTTSQLNQHLVTHTGVKNHQCPECGKSFAQRYNMMAHYRLHIGIGRKKGNKNHQCSICDDSFSSISNLRIHVKEMHSLETVSTVYIVDAYSEHSQSY